jgi:cytochrome c-type biogenesis protein CcmI
MTTTSGYDPDELARLEEQRAFLRRSLADLDRELAAGDLDAADHAALADDYGRRLGEADGEVARGRSALPAPRRRAGRLAVVALVAMVAVGAGFAVARTAGGRAPGDTITGALPQTTLGLLAEAANLARDGKITDALEVYDKVLEKDPRNVEALAERGLLLVSTGMAAERPVLVEQGRISIEDALRVKPTDPRSLFYLGLTLRLTGEPDGAAKALADALANNPPSVLRAQIEAFQASLSTASTTPSTTITTSTTGK